MYFDNFFVRRQRIVNEKWFYNEIAQSPLWPAAMTCEDTMPHRKENVSPSCGHSRHEEPHMTG